MSEVTKHEVRWELAHISNELNKVIKERVELGRGSSYYIKVHELRARRDDLLNKLKGL